MTSDEKLAVIKTFGVFTNRLKLTLTSLFKSALIYFAHLTYITLDIC